MKKIFATIIFLAAGTVSGQVLPSNFHIQKDFSFPKIQLPINRQDKIITGEIVNPVRSSTIISNFISDVVVSGDTIWFGTGRGVSRTVDQGNTFDNYYGIPPFGNDDVSAVAVYKNFVIVATSTSRDVGSEKDVPFGTGIKVSTDYGFSWTANPQPVDTKADSTIIYGLHNIVVHATPITSTAKNLTYDIAVTKKNFTSDSIVIWIASWAGEFRKSIDYGATFTRVLLPPDNLDSIKWTDDSLNFTYDPRDPPTGNDNHKGFSVIAQNDSTIWVGTAGGINKSTDWGISWRKYNFANTGNGTGISGNFVVALKVQNIGIQPIIWGATDIGGGTGQQFAGVSYTSNGGLNWGNSLGEDAITTHYIGVKDSIIYAATDNGIWRALYTPPNFAWSKPFIIYDEAIKDQIRTTLFYSVNAEGDSIWVGSGDGLCRTRELGSPWIDKWKIFRAYQPVASTTDTYAAPNPFSPKDEVTRIFFKTGKPSSTVTVKIFDFGMNLVRTVLQNAPRNTPDVIWTAWDGTRDDGRQVANGIYFYRIQVDNDVTFWGKILVLQ
ncbi:MAG: FlgD immunoglobulin-like domain containing protein [Ignavibacteria bacterium]|jgi:hypothetical protein